MPFTQSPYEWFRHLVLPWVTLALVSAAVYSRLTRSSLLDTMAEDYIRTARSKGLTERTVLYRHGLRSSLTPVVTQFGIDVGTLLGGAIVTENVFGLPGLGQLAVQSVTNQDLPVIIGIVLLAAAFIIVANIVVDARVRRAGPARPSRLSRRARLRPTLSWIPKTVARSDRVLESSR